MSASRRMGEASRKTRVRELSPSKARRKENMLHQPLEKKYSMVLGRLAPE